MRLGASSSFLRDRWVFLNLVLRLALVAWVLKSHGFLGGDSGYYLDNARGICAGNWGGDAYRTPLYGWILCALSFSQIAMILLFQTLAVWVAGVFIYKKGGRLPALVWLFDPVLLVYGNIVMSDCLFAVSVLFLAFAIADMADSRLSWMSAGFWLGIAVLLRPIGLPLMVVTVALLAVRAAIQRRSARQLAALALTLLAVLSPRLLWDHQKFGHWFLAEQGSNWIEGVAGAVENYGSGLDLYAAEAKWHHDHPDATTATAVRGILHRPAAWAWLSTLGTARVFLGHVNVEWANLATGAAPQGPGWFKEGGADSSRKVRGWGVVAWTSGVAGVLAFCFWLYFQLGCALRLMWAKRTPATLFFLAWSALAMATLALTPQVYGDARFRAPVIAVIVAILTTAVRPARVAAD